MDKRAVPSQKEGTARFFDLAFFFHDGEPYGISFEFG